MGVVDVVVRPGRCRLAAATGDDHPRIHQATDRVTPITETAIPRARKVKG
jgi:hypothetical protein